MPRIRPVDAAVVVERVRHRVIRAVMDAGLALPEGSPSDLDRSALADLLERALDDIAEIVGVDQLGVGPRLRHTVLLTYHFDLLHGRPIGPRGGREMLTGLAGRLGGLVNGSAVGEVDWVELGDTGGAIRLSGPDGRRLWEAIEPTASDCPLRPGWVLIRAGDRSAPDTVLALDLPVEIVDDVPEQLLFEVIVSMVRAFWEVPTAELRGVALRINRAEVAGRFLYEHAPGEVEEELVDLCEFYLSTEFPSGYGIDFVAEQVPVEGDLELRPGERWFYLRHEERESPVQPRDGMAPSSPYPRGMIVVVDVANVLGSRPDGWWRDRAAAAGRLLERLASLPGSEVAGPNGDAIVLDRLVAVVEGAARAAPAPTDSGLVEVVRADRDGDSAIVMLAEERAADELLVVTADRGLRQRLPPTVRTAGPNWLNGLIGR